MLLSINPLPVRLSERVKHSIEDECNYSGDRPGMCNTRTNWYYKSKPGSANRPSLIPDNEIGPSPA